MPVYGQHTFYETYFLRELSFWWCEVCWHWFMVAHNKTGSFDVLVQDFFQRFVLLMNSKFPPVLLRNVLYFIWRCNQCIIFLGAVMKLMICFGAYCCYFERVLLMNYYFHLCCYHTYCNTYAVSENSYFHLVMLSNSLFIYQVYYCAVNRVDFIWCCSESIFSYCASGALTAIILNGCC